MYTYTKLLGAIFLIATLISCSTKPTIKDVELELSTQITEQSLGTIELASIKKTNARDRNVLGISVYEIEYDMTLRFKKNVWKLSDVGYAPIAFRNYRVYEEIPKGAFLMQEFVKFEKDEEVTLKRSMMFEQTENGWRKAK